MILPAVPAAHILSSANGLRLLPVVRFEVVSAKPGLPVSTTRHVLLPNRNRGSRPARSRTRGRRATPCPGARAVLALAAKSARGGRWFFKKKELDGATECTAPTYGHNHLVAAVRCIEIPV